MPYTRKQIRVAQAVEHGWKPKGSAKGFDRGFASQVVDETHNGTLASLIRKPVKKGKR